MSLWKSILHFSFTVIILFMTPEGGMCTGDSQVLVLAEEQNFTIYCSYPNTTDRATWKLNQTSVVSEYPDIEVGVYHNNGTTCLIINRALSKYNTSIAQCTGKVQNNDTIFTATCLLVQGPLEHVSNLQFMREAGATASISVSWEAPFSLNLTTAEPDIVYCVDVYNVTEGEDLVESSCDITETSYTFTPDNPNPDHLFDFTVTPRSNVPGSLNGTTSEPVQGFVTVAPLVIPSDSVTFETNASLDPIKFVFPTQVLGTSPGQQPTGYTVDVQSVDDDDDRFSCSCPTSHVTVDDTVEITMHCNSSCTLQRHRLFNMTIVAHNNAGSSRSHPETEISTHDIVKVRAGHSLPQRQIDISCVYLDGATSEGFFTVVYSLSNHSDIIYRVAVRNGLEPTTNLSITNLEQDKYRLSVYDLVDSTIPEAIPAAFPQQVSEVNDTDNGAGTGEPQPMTTLPVSPEVTTPSGGMICISCSFSDPMTTGCVGVIHSADLVNLRLTIVPINRAISQSRKTSCISLHVSGDYLVAVFGQLPNGLETVPALTTTVTVSPDSPTSVPVPDTAIISGIVAASVISGVAVIVTVIVIVALMKNKSKSRRVQASTSDDDSGGLAEPGRYNIISSETTNTDSTNEIKLLKLLPDDHPSHHYVGESPFSKDKPNDTESVHTGHKVIMVKESASTGNLQVPRRLPPIKSRPLSASEVEVEV